MNHRRWRLPPSPPPGFLKELGQPPLVNQLLYNRGLTDAAKAKAFLDIGPGLQHDPFLLVDMEKAAARIRQALVSQETIVVYGDFDADGVCGTAILVEGLGRLGGKVLSYFPHRVQEGYGLNNDSIDKLQARGASLIITVDCGITNNTEVAYAQSRGLDVIITDHHNVMSGLPPALATVNPKRPGSPYPFDQLAGVGVAFKLLQAVSQSLGREEDLDEMLDLVAMGTVADKVPLLDENRYLVHRGLEVLRQTRRPGLRAMMEVARLDAKYLDADAIAWTMAPRLNAPGRLDHAMTSYRLVLATSSEEANLLAQQLEERNSERQRLTEEFLTRAKAELSAAALAQPFLMIGGEDYPSGIAGLIAGRLAEEFYRPSVVYELREATASGSARSIPEFDIISALSECRDLLQRFGGHPGAAGFALPRENLEPLRQRLLEMAQRQLAGIDLRPHLSIDAVIPLSGIGGKTYRVVDRFAPFGHENPMPVFLSRRVGVVDHYPIGNASQHLRLRLRDGGISWKGVGFDLGGLDSEIAPEIDIVYNLVIDRWNGEESLALNILDFAPST
ncbi:MAG: single-stranded-DNA-specific exonuclease RecJ [Dehalococcoidia bacterium]|nr:single-stranded-DNA-specific exonuclease RecJ [Dehalococcoidia bacterium]